MPILHWLTRDKDICAAGEAPYRLLEEVPDLSYGARDTSNMLIQGDNLDALKALLPFYAGQVKCIYIDPPFNTTQAFPDFDDNLEHTTWLGMMYPRIELLCEFLSRDGSLFIHLDDNEIDYAKVVADNIFGRKNFVQRIILKARSPSAFSTVNPGVFKSSEYILWYAKDKSAMWQSRIWVQREPDLAYNKYIDNIEETHPNWRITSLGPHVSDAMRKAKTPQAANAAIKKFYVANAAKIARLAEIDDEGAGQDIVAVKRKSQLKPGVIFRHDRANFEPIFILDGQQLLFYRKNIHVIDGEKTPARMLTNIWDDISWEGIAREGGVRFPQAKKPERLVRRCLQLTTIPGDLVLDSFQARDWY